MLFLVLIHFQVITSNFTSYPQISYTGGIKKNTLKFLWEHCYLPTHLEYIELGDANKLYFKDGLMMALIDILYHVCSLF